MKRWVFWSFAFLLTFGIGIAVAFLALSGPTPNEVVPVQFEHREIIVAEPIKQDDFIPEFSDLPDFEELYPDEPELDGSEERLIEIFDNGIYRQSEVVAKNGESWWVLTRKMGNFSLQRSTAVIKKRKSVSWPGDEPDAKLSFKVSGKPIFAIKDIRGLRSGPVTTLFQQGVWEKIENGHQELSDYYRREFFLGKNKYILRTSRGITKDRTKVAVLVLEVDDVKQVLVQKYHVPSDDRDIIGSLLWAGDLDGDGKLDLISTTSMKRER